MTEARTVELSGDDLDVLAAQLGDVWVERFLGERTRSNAVRELCRTVDELTTMDFGGQLRLAQIMSRSEVAAELAEALRGVVRSERQRTQTANIIVAALTSEILLFALANRKHQRRVDGRGCICGWNGTDLVQHLITVRRNVEAVELATYDFIAEETSRYLQALLQDPDWAASYWVARNRAEDDVGLLFVALHRLGAEISLHGREYHIRFVGGGKVDHPLTGSGVFFPLSVDNYDWSQPPGRLLRIWADASGLSDEEIAQACELSLDVYRSVVAGTTHITTDTAAKLEAGTKSFPANTWLMLERNYRAALVDRANRPRR